MNKFFTIFIPLSLLFLLTNSFKNKKQEPTKSSGAAAVFGIGHTGASFDGGTCANCHGGGSFGAALNVELLNTSNMPVTTYTPGQSYILKLIVSSTGSNYGFQTTCATTASNTNINTWGASLPTNVQNTTASSRNYIEQNTTLNTSTINIPWVAPLTGTGSVDFYSIANVVDAGGGTSGDQPTAPSKITIAEASSLASNTITLIANKRNNNVNLSWVTSQDDISDKFILEHSNNGINFTTIKEIAANNSQSLSNNKYQYQHNNLENKQHFYRLVQFSTTSKKTYSNIVAVSISNNKNDFILKPNPVINKIELPNDILFNAKSYNITSISGAVLQIGKIQNSYITTEKIFTGPYLLNILMNDGTTITKKFFKQ